MIYTRFGTPVKLLTSEIVHEQHKDGYWVTVYYVTAEQSAAHPQEPQRAEKDIGRPILDGKQFNASELIADDGWSEIEREVHRLAPDNKEPAREAYDPKKHERDLRWVMG